MSRIISTGKTLASEGFYKKKLQIRRKKILIFSAIILVLLIVLVLVLRLKSLQIKDIEVVGAEVIGADAVAERVNEFISGHYLWLIPKNSIFIYPDGSLKEFLFKSFPRFSFINLSLSNPERLVVSVVEREPFALYCVQDVCYFLDESGFIFDQAPYFSQGVYFVYRSEVLFEEPIGKQFVSESEFWTLSEFIKTLEGETLEMGESLVLITKNGVKIIWNRGSDLNKLSVNLEAFLNNPAIDQSRLSELDLRTENKVFYRTK